EDPRAVFIVERAGEGTLGVLFAQDRILLRRKQLAPFLRRVGDFECADHGCAAAADQAKPDPRRTNRGEGKGARTELASCDVHGSSPLGGARSSATGSAAS